MNILSFAVSFRRHQNSLYCYHRGLHRQWRLNEPIPEAAMQVQTMTLPPHASQISVYVLDQRRIRFSLFIGLYITLVEVPLHPTMWRLSAMSRTSFGCFFTTLTMLTVNTCCWYPSVRCLLLARYTSNFVFLLQNTANCCRGYDQ